MKKLTISIGVGLVMLGVPVRAFKPKTHVWVAQQVLNDVVPDGKVTVAPFGEFAVAPDIVEALRAFPDHYRMGHIGPDAFPDVIGGQVTMHPGEGWSAGEWIRHTLSNVPNPATLAFAHGYAGHAAGDTFAHTYVNLYAGDIFLLEDEQAVEVRHFALEDFIARHTPSLVDHEGNPVAFEALAVDATAVRDLLLYAPADQYDRVAPHLALMAAYRRTLLDAENYTSQFKLDLMNKYLQPQLDILRVQLDAVESLKNAYEDLQREESRLRARAQDIPGEVARAENSLVNLEAQAANLASDAGRKACLTGCELCTGKIKDPIFGTEIGCDKGECQRNCNSAFDGVNSTIDATRGQIARLNDEKATLGVKLIEIANQVADAKAKYEQQLSSDALRLAKRSVADLQAAVDSANQLEALLKLWRQDIERATTAYIQMSRDMAVELVGSDGSPLEPFFEWLNCWAPVFSGMPALVPQAACTAKNYIVELRQDYQRLMESLGSARYLIDPVGSVTDDLKREYAERVMDAIEGEISRGLMTMFVEMGREDLAHVVNLLMQGSEGNALNDYYSQDQSGKGLLRIGDIQARVLADMHLTDAGVFDELVFSPARNAVTLAKLSLLGHDAVVQLVQAAGGNTTAIMDSAPFNVLLGVKSIDGNHQWQMKAPAYFRQNGWHPREKADLHSYALTPLLFWEPELREKLFLRLFVGPVAPNLESPCPDEFMDLVSQDYPYRACAANPFPDSEAVADPTRCRPQLVVDSFTVNEEQPHLMIATTVLNNAGGRAARGKYRFSVCEADCKKERTLLRGDLQGRVCTARPQPRTDTVLLPYLKPGAYDFVLTVTQSEGGEQVKKTHRIEVPACREMYVVRRGDTLYGLGEKFSIDPWKIAARNRILALSEIPAGGKLCIP